MKTKELIRQLQEADPSGEIECCIDNADIFFVERLPAYYDGRLQTLKRDKNGQITGAKVISKGDKIKIYPLSIQEHFLDNPELEVQYETDNEFAKEWLEKERQKAKDIIEEVDKDMRAKGFIKQDGN